MDMQKLIPAMRGYKATDKNMRCRGFQFELGKWYEHDGELEECASGFHFCVYLSGVWSYYSEPGTRVWAIEAEDVLDKPDEPGVDVKRVARRIRFISEIAVDGDRNCGDRNSGDGNCGDRNSGDRNSGDRNSGHRNSGDRNSGHRNCGHGNSGDRNSGHGNSGYENSGDRNSGHGNSGDRNCGDRNSGHGNSGHGNSGHGNSGDGNATDYSNGFFNTIPQKVICFNKQTSLTHSSFQRKYPEYAELRALLMEDDPIPFGQFSRLPGITPQKLRALHKKHKQARIKQKDQ